MIHKNIYDKIKSHVWPLFGDVLNLILKNRNITKRVSHAHTTFVPDIISSAGLVIIPAILF